MSDMDSKPQPPGDENGHNRRDMLKSCVHFAFIVGGVAALTSGEPPPAGGCGNYMSDDRIIYDLYCNLAPSWPKDSDCNKSTEMGGMIVSPDDHCGQADPNSAPYTPSDASCGGQQSGSHIQDADCGKIYDSSVSSITWSDSDCGASGEGGRLMADNDCGHISDKLGNTWPDNYPY